MSMYKCSFQIHTQFLIPASEIRVEDQYLAKPCFTMSTCDRIVESFFFIDNSHPQLPPFFDYNAI